jgi:hypothetical protein
MIAYAKTLDVLQVLRSVLRSHYNLAELGFGTLLPPLPAVSTKAGRTILLRLSDVNILW